MKLTEEQHRELLDLVEGEGFKVLTTVLLPQLVQKQVDHLLSVDYVKAEREFTIERAKLEGAKKLVNEIKSLKDYFRKISTNQRKNA